MNHFIWFLADASWLLQGDVNSPDDEPYGDGTNIGDGEGNAFSITDAYYFLDNDMNGSGDFVGISYPYLYWVGLDGTQFIGYGVQY